MRRQPGCSEVGQAQASTDQIRMGVDDFFDALARERLLPEVALDIVEDAHVGRVRLDEDVLRCKLCLPEPVTEVLHKYPVAVYGGSSGRVLP